MKRDIQGAHMLILARTWDDQLMGQSDPAPFHLSCFTILEIREVFIVI